MSGKGNVVMNLSQEEESQLTHNLEKDIMSKIMGRFNKH